MAPNDPNWIKSRNWVKSRTPAPPTPRGGFSTGPGTRYEDEEFDPINAAKLAGFGSQENPMDAAAGEQDKVRQWLESKSAGVGLEADRVTADRQHAYSQGLKSALASRRGAYDPNVARQVERQRSAAAMHGAREGRLAGQTEQQDATKQLVEFETKMDAANTAYQNALGVYEAQVNTFNSEFKKLYDVAFAQSKSHELAKENAMGQLAATQQVRLLAQFKADRDAAARDLENQMAIFSGILGGSANVVSSIAGKVV